MQNSIETEMIVVYGKCYLLLRIRSHNTVVSEFDYVYLCSRAGKGKVFMDPVKKEEENIGGGIYTNASDIVFG